MGTADPGGLDVERLADAMGRYYGDNIETGYLYGAEAHGIAREYAALTPEATAPDRTADPGGLDVEYLRAAMHVVLNGNKDAARFVLREAAPDYIAERIAVEYRALTPEATAPEDGS